MSEIQHSVHSVSSAKEVEVKLQLPSASPSRLRQVPLLRDADGPAQKQKQVSVYFDTESLKLRKHGLTLRVRHVGNRYVQTIKSDNGGLFERGEWETEVESEQPDLTRGDTSALDGLDIKKLGKQLRPVFETRVERTTYPFARKDYEIELTIDRGEIDAGDHSLPLCEAEFELKRGDRARLFEFAAAFARATAAELAVKSKSQRGYELLSGEESAATRGEDIEIAPDTPAKTAFQLIAFDCLKQVISNKPAVLAGNAEGIHQMRVGLRRLRAGISLFSDIVADAKTKHIKAELKWLTNELGPAREFEVFLTRVVAPLGKQHARLAGMRSLSHDLADQRETAIARAIEAVSSLRFRELTLDCAAWLEIGDWREPQDEALRARCDEPIEHMARTQLKKHWKKIRKRGRELASLDPHARHKLRIRIKKLRYATEFYKAVFPEKKPHKRRAAFLSALKDLQDCFGELNDIFVHEKLTAGIVETPNAASAKSPRRVFAAGLLTGHEEARLEPVLADAERSFAAFDKLQPYWD
ncbi:MAG TPA: CHAD domain-containing protein [Bradyrhizobium sp.]|nr:CHAD domain-containing protein [Bradyrhizobium sp.]